MSKPSKNEIFELLENAKENGSFEKNGYMDGWSADAIADDMLWLTDLECETTDIVPFIQEWLLTK